MSNDKNAQELLKWGLSHSTSVTSTGGPSVEQISADIEAGRRPDLADPRLYDAIMGKSEAQMMREELAVALDTTLPLDSRCTALDNFELLIEQIDNANNMTAMKMWAPIISLLSADQVEIQTAAAWILGTAVQNNDKAQMAVLEFKPVAALTHLLQSENEQVRAKAMYALSGLLKHNPAAMDQFDKLDGWKALRSALVDPNIGLRRKTAFLINALLFQDPNSFNHIPSSNTNTTTSSATALAPVPTSATSASANTPVAPLEQPPATQLTSIPHPNVPQALLSSSILLTLLSSLLPSNTPGILTDLEPSGPNGDMDPRSDLDFAEKATTAILTFTSKLPNNVDEAQLDESLKGLFKALLQELEGKPLDEADGAKTRWSELGIEQEAFTQFKNKVQTW